MAVTKRGTGNCTTTMVSVRVLLGLFERVFGALYFTIGVWGLPQRIFSNNSLESCFTTPAQRTSPRGTACPENRESGLLQLPKWLFKLNWQQWFFWGIASGFAVAMTNYEWAVFIQNCNNRNTFCSLVFVVPKPLLKRSLWLLRLLIVKESLHIERHCEPLPISLHKVLQKQLLLR